MKLIQSGSNERLRISHVLNVPRDVAFTWWSDATKLERWIGCKAAERCEIDMDFRVGGSFMQTMHVSGRGVFRITGVYEDIVVPERIAYRASFDTISVHTVIDFLDFGGKTKVTITQEGYPDRASADHALTGKAEAFEALECIVSEKRQTGGRHRRTSRKDVR